MGFIGFFAIWAGLYIFKTVRIMGPIEYLAAVSASPDLDNLIPKAGSKTKMRKPKEVVDAINNNEHFLKGGRLRVYGDRFRHFYKITSADLDIQTNTLTLNFKEDRKLEIVNPRLIFESPTFLKIVNADFIQFSWRHFGRYKNKEALFYLKGTSKNSTLVANLFFIPTTSLPKYSFSPAKFRFQRLVSEKNNFLIIPNRVIRDALEMIIFRNIFCFFKII